MMSLKLSKNSSPKRILVISQTNIGDVVLTCPVIDILCRDYPKARMDVVIGPKAASLFEGNPHFGVKVYNKHAGLAGQITWFQELQRNHYDCVVDLRRTALGFFLMPRYAAPVFFQSHQALAGHKKQMHLDRLRQVHAFDGPAAQKSAVVTTRDDEIFFEGAVAPALAGRSFVVMAPGAASSEKPWHGQGFSAVAEGIRNFFPVVTARGVVQISAYIDNLLASLLPTGAVSALAYAQLLYLLPVSLFGMSVSAAELPAMSSAVGTPEQIHAYLRGKLDTGLKRIAFFIVPSMAAFLILGDVIIAALFQSGAFTRANTVYVWGVLAGSTVGLLAATLGRLYSSTFYALHDTRTPLRFAIVRVLLTTGLGYVFAFPLPRLLGLDISWGTAGLTCSAGIAGWVEFLLLRRSLNSKIGTTGLESGYVIRLWASALLAATFAGLIKLGIASIHAHTHPKIAAFLILGPYGALYFVISAYLFQLEESKSLLNRFGNRIALRRLR